MGTSQRSGAGFSGYKGVIGGSGSLSAGRAEQRADSALAPCPCGADGVWYRIQPPAALARGRSLGQMTADDITDNLCDACFLLAVSEDKRAEWKRLETEHEIDQDRYGAAAFEASQVPDGWE